MLKLLRTLPKVLKYLPSDKAAVRFVHWEVLYVGSTVDPHCFLMRGGSTCDLVHVCRMRAPS